MKVVRLTAEEINTIELALKDVADYVRADSRIDKADKPAIIRRNQSLAEVLYQRIEE